MRFICRITTLILLLVLVLFVRNSYAAINKNTTVSTSLSTVALKAATASTINDQVKCNGESNNNINFEGIGNPLHWVISNPSIWTGPSEGTSTIGHNYTLINEGNTIAIATITATGKGTGGQTVTESLTITVYPNPTVNQVKDIAICYNTLQSSIVLSSPKSGTQFSWVNDNTAIGLGASGTGNIPEFTATNKGTTPLIANITVTPTNLSGCQGIPMTFKITVHPPTQINPINNTNTTFCNNQQSQIIFSTSNPGGTTTYSWTNSNTNIGLPASGKGDISFVTTNKETKPITSDITVTPYNSNGCPGPPRTFTATVNPTAQVDQPLSQAICNGTPIITNFSTQNTGGNTSYSWVNSESAIGLASSGTGNISFTATNTTTSPLTATITVTPTYSNGGATCTGPSKTYTYTVYPEAQINQPEDITVCNGQFTTTAFSTINGTGTTTYSWTNDNPEIGLATSGEGNIAFNAVNSSLKPISATITVTPIYKNGGTSCPGIAKTFRITVNPIVKIVRPSNVVTCSGQSTSVTFSSLNTGGTINYNWTNDNPAIGLPASGNGNIMFVSKNVDLSPITATITVTPIINSGAISCQGEPAKFTITVNPNAQLNLPENIVGCNGESLSVDFSSQNLGGTTSFSWVNNNTDIGLAANGTGNIRSFTARNTTTSPITSTITVTPTFTSGGIFCSGQDKKFNITINPEAQVNQPTDQILCNEEPVFINFTTINTGGTTTYSWVNDNPAIGLSTSGNGNLSFVTKNTGTSPIVANISVTPIYTNGGTNCPGPTKTFKLTINPITAQVNQPADQIVCTNQDVAVNFSTINTGGVTSYSWTNNNPAIGLAESGTGNISFTSANTGNAPASATIMVTPNYTNGGVTCTGIARSFTITVNPAAQVNQPTDMFVCNNQGTVVNFTSANTQGTVTYTWTNDNPTIGLATNGIGSISEFTAINNGKTPITATIIVTPTFANKGLTCPGSPKTFKITVNPSAQVNQPENMTVCNNQNTTVSFGTNNTGGTTTYNWSNDNPAIGLAVSGSGDISFTAQNGDIRPVTATITVTPTYSNEGTTCSGPARQFTITVNPSAQVIQPEDVVFCNGPTPALNFASANAEGTTTYAWTNDNPAIGLTPSGIGNIASFDAHNTSSAPVHATIWVTPTYSNGGATCTGDAKSFAITINPQAQINPLADQIFCNEEPVSINFTTDNTGGTTTYSWVNDNPAIGLSTSGNGNLSFVSKNTSSNPIVANISVTPTYANGGISCPGPTQSFQLTINPATAQVNKPADQIVCANQEVTVDFSTSNTGGSTLYTWTNDNPAIGLAESGSGNIRFTSANTGKAPVTATIMVTPNYTNGGVTCTGIARSFTITVNPMAQVHRPADMYVCNSQNTAVAFTSENTEGTVTYTWTNDNTSIGLANNGTGNIPGFTAINNGSTPVTANITVTPSYSNEGITCPGPQKTFKIIVNPSAQVKQPENMTVCNNQNTTVSFGTINTGGTTIYNWSNDNPAIGLAASGSGDISFTAQNGDIRPVTTTITVTPTYSNGGSTCTGQAKQFTITINPTAQVIQPEDRIFCNGWTPSLSFASANAEGTTTYAWTNNNTAIGLAASGIGNIESFDAHNTSSAPIKATISVIPTYSNGGGTCTGDPKSFAITINPQAQVNRPADQIFCNEEPVSINFTTNNTGGTTTYNWVNDNPAIGLSTSGNGNLSFVSKNTGSSPIVANISVTPTYANGGISCSGPTQSFQLTINPATAQVNQPANQIVCANKGVTVDFSTANTGGSTSYTWTNDNPAIGLAESGSGNISFTSVNTGKAPVTATIMVTPNYTNGGVTCTGIARSFTITVNPIAQVKQPADVYVCNNQGTAVTFTSENTGGDVSYTWTNDNTSIGLANSGTGNIPGFIAINNGSTPITATISVTPSYSNEGITCSGPLKTFKIIVNPSAQVNKPENMTVCNNQNTTVSFGTDNTGGTTTYDWVNANPAIGLAASGSGDISFTAQNGDIRPVTTTITVTPTYSNGGTTCPGQAKQFTITINPTAQVIQPEDRIFCNGWTPSLSFASANAEGTTTYAWTNNNTAIGLAASGIGNIESFDAHNTSSAPIKATISVIPTYSTGGGTCTGDPKSFAITINPQAQVDRPADQIFCNEEPVVINFTTKNTGGTTTYSWVNDNPAIGLSDSGSGNLSFVTKNTSSSPIVANISVTPTYTNGGISCSGPTQTFQLIINPATAQVNQPANQIVCDNKEVIVNFSTANTGGATSYTWTNDNPAIGLAESGSGNISFISANTGNAPATATIMVTPNYTNGGVTCTGVARSFTITVNPVAQVNQPADLYVCNKQGAAVTFTSGNTGGEVSYTWTNDNTSIGLANSGTGNISEFTAINDGSTPITATISVTPSYTNGGITCSGTQKTFKIIVNPTAQVNQPDNMTVCNNQNTTVSFGTNTSGGTTTYSWVNNNPAIGLTTSGTGDISFTAQNGDIRPVTTTITVTPTYSNGGTTCTGPAKQFTITVNPAAQVTQPDHRIFCNGMTPLVSFASSNLDGTTTYAWTNDNPAIGLAASGTGNIESFDAQNSSSAPVKATISVTPTYSNGGATCTGTPKSFTIVINPEAQVNQPVDQIFCNEEQALVNFTSNNTGGTTTYSWVNDNQSIGLPGSGNGNLSFVTKNTGTSPIVANITVTPTYTTGGVSCSGPAKTFKLTINPVSAQVNQPADLVVCSSQNTVVNFSTVNTGGATSYIWTNNNPAIGLPESGSGNINFTSINTGTSPATATIMVTPSFTNGGATCTGVPRSFTITVNPVAQVNQPADLYVCNAQGGTVTFTSGNTGGDVSYTWTNDNPTIGLATNGTGNISEFTAINNGITPISATITVTPAFTKNGVTCTGLSKTFKIIVNPTGQVNQPANMLVCNKQATTVSFETNTLGGATTYNWVNDNPAIGLPAAGSGNISFTSQNGDIRPITATITVIPTYTNGGTPCPGPAKQFTITVNPSAQVIQPEDMVFCNGPTPSINFASTNAEGTTTYSWINDNPAIGLASSGIGNIESFTARNTSSAPVKATILVTPTYSSGGATCTGTAKSFTITINPEAQVNQPADEILCNEEPAVINFTTNNTGGTTTYSWRNDNPAIGLADTGNGDLSFVTNNTGTSPIYANITVTPTYTNGGTSCSGPIKTFKLTVNPVKAQINQPADQIVCTNQEVTANFSTVNTGGATSYLWTNNNPAIGLPESGAGNIRFTSVNQGTAPVTATIMVTPSYINDGVTCTGVTKSFTITVNPVAQVKKPADLTACSSQPVTINFETSNTGGTTSYKWTNDNMDIGLEASGDGNINFVSQNSSNKPITANISVTPIIAGCSGQPQMFTITINPKAQVNQLSDLTSCSNQPLSITFGTENTGGTTSYSWTNNNPGIGLPIAGNGNISFMTKNTGTSTQTATITVIPEYSNGGQSCPGTPQTFTITVNQDAQVNQPRDMVVCNGETSNVEFSTLNSGDNTLYTWTNDTPGIGLPASGTGSIAPFTAINGGTSPLKATITVIPTFVKGGISCSGNSKTFTITVNPSVQMNQPTDEIICNSEPVSIDFSSNNSGGTTNYTWTNSNPAIGLEATGNGNIYFISKNAGSTPITANIAVTPSFTSGGITCTGQPYYFTITVNPISAQVDQPKNVVVCHNHAAVVNFSTVNNGGTTTYTWTNNTPGIGLEASGTGNIAFTAINGGSSPVSAIISVTPIYSNGTAQCTGIVKQFMITVNPAAEVKQPTDMSLCDGQSTSVQFESTNTGGTTTYTWTNDNPSIGLPISGSGNLQFTSQNGTSSAITATITVTPTFTNGTESCPGAPKTFKITVVPAAQVNQPADITTCNNESISVSFGTINSNNPTSYRWINDNPLIGLPATGTGYPSFTAQNTSNTPITASITVIPSLQNGNMQCEGTPKTFTITVNPTAQVNQPSDMVICNDQPVTLDFTTINTGGITTYSWSCDNSDIGLSPLGNGSLSFIARNKSNTPITAAITVTPTFSYGNQVCSGTSKTFVITVNPSAQVNQPANVSLCNQEPANIDFSTTNTNGTTTYNWVNDNPSIGLPASGSGNLSFTTINDGKSPVTATIAVTPVYNNGGVSCTGDVKTFTITVSPIKAQINQPADVVTCNTQPVSVKFSTVVAGGITSYFWTNDNPAIGLEATGSGDISFIGTNPGKAPVTATITVTPTYSNENINCTGEAKTFKITINPDPQVNQPLDVTLCDNQPAVLSFTTINAGGTTTYAWTNDNPFIGLASTGNGPLSFTPKNGGTRAITANITVTPTFSYDGVSCSGGAKTFKIIVEPTAVVNQPVDVITCNDKPTLVEFTSDDTNNATNYTWTNDNPEIGLPSSGSGNLSFNAVNKNRAPITANIVVTPTLNNGCPGLPKVFKITVNPAAQVNQPDNEIICNNNTLSVDFTTVNTGGSTIYYWTNDNTSIGLLANGTGNISNFTVKNSTSRPVIANISVTPVFVNGAVSCPGTPKTFTVTVNPSPTITSAYNQTICSGNTFSVIPLNGAGNMIPDSTHYIWSAPVINPVGSITGGTAQNMGQLSISQTLTNHSLQPATATYMVTPVYADCRGTDFPITITVNPSPAVVFSIGNQTICSGEKSQLVSLSSNATGNVSLEWTAVVPAGITGAVTSGSNTITAQSLSNTTAAPLTIVYSAKATAESATTCPGTVATYSITVNPPFDIKANTSNYNGYQISAAGVSDGWIDITINGSNNSFTYLWTGPNGFTSNQQDLTNVPAGTYNLVVSDNTGCSKNISLTMTQPATFIISAETTPITCYGENNASIRVIAKGGMAPYQFTWSNGGSGASQSNLSAGIYHIVVTDANGQQKSLDATIAEAPVFKISPVTVNTSGPGMKDGIINLNLVGGQAPVSIIWGDAPTAGAVRTNLGVGNYNVTINDANACVITRTFSIQEQPKILIIADVSDISSCKNTQSGAISLTVSGGVAPYSYTWSNGSTTKNLMNIPAGSYTVLVKDSLGATGSQTIEVKDITSIRVNIAQELTLDCTTNAINVMATANVAGGATPYTYKWSKGIITGTNGESMTTNQAGIVSLVVTDANGCTSQHSFNIETVPTVGVMYQVIDCDKRTYKFNSLTSGNLNDSYTYSWDFGDGKTSALKEPIHTFMTTGTYTVRLKITGASCTNTFTQTMLVGQAPLISIDRESPVLICQGDSIDINVFGAKSYQWGNGSTANKLLINKAGTYYVEGTSVSGCKSFYSFDVKYYDLFNFTIQTDKDHLSVDNSTVKIWSEEIPLAHYYWDLGDGYQIQGNQVTHTYEASGSGYFDIKLKVINPNGCVENATKRIWIDEPQVPNTLTPNGDGKNDIFMPNWNIQIYNRNGIMIYKGNQGWDGNYKSKPVTNDTYFYLLEYMSVSGMKRKTGFVTVIH